MIKQFVFIEDVLSSVKTAYFYLALTFKIFLPF